MWKDYRKFWMALLTTVLMAIHAGLSEGSLFLPTPWDQVALALVGAVLVFVVRNGDKEEEA